MALRPVTTQTQGPDAGCRDAPPPFRLALVIALLSLVAWTFSAGLGAGYVFDDRGDVLENPASTPAGFLAALGTTNRPLLKATYAAQRAMFGAGPFSYHTVNLALHLATTFLVLALIRRIIARRALPATADVLAALGAAAWALHPAAVETVVPVVGRSVGLSSLLLLAALLIATGERQRPLGMLAAGTLAFAAPLARETALVLPALGLLWQATLGAGDGRRAALRRQLPLAAGTGLAAVALSLSERHRDLISYSLGVRRPLEALRGNVNAVFDILAIWIFPGRVSIDPAAPADLAWTAWPTILHVTLLAATALAVLCFRRRHPAAAFALGWTLIVLSPTNSIIWRLDPVAVRPLYPASIGPVLLAALCAAHLCRRLAPLAPLRRATAAGAGLALGVAAVAALAAAGASRAALYTDPVALWSDAAAKAPRQARPQVNLGVQLLLRDRLDSAESAFRNALALDPGSQNARCALDAIRVRRLAATFDQRSQKP